MMRVTGLRLARVAMVLLATGAAAAATAAAADAHPHGRRLVVAPKAGHVLHSDVVRIAIRTGIDPGDLKARLNGVPIAAGFGLVRGGVRSLRASSSYGLRAGRNVLVVAVHRIGKRVRRSRVRFSVRTAAPMVGAGRDRRAVVGDVISLNGKTTTSRKGQVHSQWQVTGGPKCGDVASAKLSHPASAHASFRTQARGTYTLRLRARRGSAIASDAVTLEEVPHNPLVSVHTITNRDGSVGTDVGGVFFAAPDRPGNSSKFVQVLVLRRQSLGCVSNTAYVDLGQLQAALQKLKEENSDVLVIATVHDATQFRDTDVARALGPIGFPEFSFGGFTTNGSISAIGSPAAHAGDADLNLDGGMDGYLTPDTNLEYRFISPQRIPFGYPKLPDTRCNPSSQDCNAIGFAVTDIDAHTGNARVNATVFETDPRNGDAEFATDQANKMADFLNRIPRGDVVGIETVSNRLAGEKEYPAPVGPVDRTAMVRLADAIADAGGTRNGFNTAALHPGPADGAPVYSLVGWAGAGEGRGAEAAIGVDGATDSPYLNGVLRRDSLYEFRPAQTSQTGLVSDTVQNLILDQPKDSWPYSNDPKVMAAFKAIGAQEPQLGSDPRHAFWTQEISAEQADAIANHITQHVHYADIPHEFDGVSFDESDFNKAKQELTQELAYVANVRRYMSKLSEPSAAKALASWGEVQNIAQKVFDKAQNPRGETVTRWTEFTRILLELLGPLTDDVSSEVGGLLDLGMWAAGAESNGSPAGGDLHTEASELGITLQREAVEAKETYTQLGDIIVSDYAKLKTVGINGGCNADGTAPCNKAFAYSDADRVKASAAAYRGIQRIAYEKLVPLGFPVYALNSDPADLAPGDRNRPPEPLWYHCGAVHPFYQLTPPAWTSLLEVVDPVGHLNTYQVFALTTPPDGAAHADPPPADLLDRMFKRVPASNDVAADGLGISPDELMRTARPHYEWKSSGGVCRFG